MNTLTNLKQNLTLATICFSALTFSAGCQKSAGDGRQDDKPAATAKDDGKQDDQPTATARADLDIDPPSHIGSPDDLKLLLSCIEDGTVTKMRHIQIALEPELVTADLLEKLASLNLEGLTLQNADLSELDILKLQLHKNLTSLTIYEGHPGEGFFEGIAQLSTLQYLDLSHVEISEGDLSKLSELGLKSIVMSAKSLESSEKAKMWLEFFEATPDTAAVVRPYAVWLEQKGEQYENGMHMSSLEYIRKHASAK